MATATQGNVVHDYVTPDPRGLDKIYTLFLVVENRMHGSYLDRLFLIVLK
jgi:hypothetical protein